MDDLTLEQRLAAIEPVLVEHLPAFLRAVTPVAQQLLSGDWLGALAEHGDRVIEATAIGACVDRSWLDKQRPDVLIKLASRVIEVNADFFVHQVLPLIEVGSAAITAALEATMQASSLSMPGSLSTPAQGSALSG